MLLWLLVLQFKSVLGTCRNFDTKINPSMFREGDWYDLVRVYQGPGEYVADRHSPESVSMFLAKYNTNCGYFELQRSGIAAFELYKGYYTPRFKEHFYPFKVKIERNYDQLNSHMFLEKSQCEHYSHLNETVRKIDILETDYSSFMLIHQCVDDLDYLMLLTENTRFRLSEKYNIEAAMIDVMRNYGIEIENRMFSWVETNFCDKMLQSSIFPSFYSKKFIDRNQTGCPENLPFEMIELKQYWENKIENAEKKWQLKKQVIICSVVMVLGTIFCVGMVAINLDNINWNI